MMNCVRSALILFVLLLAHGLCGAELPDITTLPEDMKVPAIFDGVAAAGRRVKQTTRGWETTAVHHALYLPTNWKRGGRFPVLVEFAGNGGYKNGFGDT